MLLRAFGDRCSIGVVILIYAVPGISVVADSCLPCLQRSELIVGTTSLGVHPLRLEFPQVCRAQLPTLSF